MPPAPKPSAAALSVSHYIHFPRLPREDSGKTPDSCKEVGDKSKRLGCFVEMPHPHIRSSTPAERRLCLMCARKGSAIPWGVQRAGQCLGSLAEDTVLEDLVMVYRHGCSVGP